MASAINLYEEERKLYKEKEISLDGHQAKITELQTALEKYKESSRKEIDRLHYDYTETITDLKSFHQSVNIGLRLKLRLNRKNCL